MASLTDDDKRLIELVFVRTIFEKDIARAQAMVRLGYGKAAIVNRTHIPLEILHTLHSQRKWHVDKQARKQKAAYLTELRAKYRKGYCAPLTKKTVNEIRERCGFDEIRHRAEIGEAEHEFTKKELAEWVKRLNPNHIPDIPDIEPYYRHKTPGTKNVILGLVSDGKTILASFAALGFNSTIYKRWLQDEPDFELALIRAVSRFQEKIIKHIQVASIKDWRAGAWILEHHPDIRDQFKEPKEAPSPAISINFSRDSTPSLPQIDQGVLLEHDG